MSARQQFLSSAKWLFVERTGPLTGNPRIQPSRKQRWKTLFHELRREIFSLRNHNKELADRAYTDQLTKLPNRHALEELLPELLNKHGAIGVIAIDIDRFKRVNDTLGHAGGDAALQHMGNKLNATFLPAGNPWYYMKHCRLHTDANTIAFRTGGEEFVIVMPGNAEADIVREANKLRADIAESSCIDPVSGKTISFTISAGVTTCNRGDSVGAALTRADQALYHAKHTGRDRVCTFSEVPADVMGSSRNERRPLPIFVADLSGGAN